MRPQTLSLLELLLEAPGDWHYGYELARGSGLKSGTLYPILIRLADRGWLESQWQQQAGEKPRHMYRLTAHGRKAARLALAEASTSLKTLKPAMGES